MLAVTFIVIPKMQYPQLAFNDTHTTKKVDYYLDPQKVTLSVFKQSRSVEFATADGKFTLLGQANIDLVDGLKTGWSKTFEDSNMFTLVPPVTCTSLLLRFKYLDYTQLEALSCIISPTQYSDLI